MCISSLGFTSYPFWDEYDDGYVNSSHKYCVENTSTDYFTNLAMAKAVAGDDISFRTFVQTGEGFEYTPNNNYTKGQFLWNANTNLAFGSKGTQYFPMVHPESLKNYSDGTCASGLLDATGEKTKYYVWAKEVNQQIAAVDDILMNATNKGYMSTGGYAKTKATDVVSEIKLYNTNTVSSWTDPVETIRNTIVDSTKGYNGATVSSSDTTYGAFVGCFEMNKDSKYAGNHAMYIVNFNADNENTNTITVNLGSSKEVTVIYNGETRVMTADKVVQTLSAGEAVLVVY